LGNVLTPIAYHGSFMSRRALDSSTSAVDRARALLASLDVPASDPFAAPVLRARRALGDRPDPSPLFAFWKTREAGSLTGALRYRWDLSHQRSPLPAWAGEVDTWKAWRPAEETLLTRDPYAFEERLTVPIIVAEACELLEELAEEGEGTVASDARALLIESLPVFRRDLATYVQAIHSWTDTFGLWCLVRRRRALARLHPLAIAIASCYAAGADRSGTVLGTRYPFHDMPIVSGSAHLAAALVLLGLEFPLVTKLTEWVGKEQKDDGGWGDAGGPSDVLTTFAAADLLSHLDPSYDPASTARFFAARQEPSGLWRALGPEAPWLTAEIATWIDASTLPFATRFRWPVVAEANLDHKTKIPFFSYFDHVARLFAEIPGLARSNVEIAFIDLAGFRAFNNKYGQDMGDDVLFEFARELAKLPAAQAIRDGGDEFLVLGAPERHSLVTTLHTFREHWPAHFAKRFGADAPPVAPRILVATTRGGALRAVREKLGRSVGSLKAKEPTPGATGVLADLGRIDP
jgi:GGDEF domain-containing protein